MTATPPEGLPDRATLISVLRSGLTWLYATHQPDDALDQHHGQSLWVAGRTYTFTPCGYANLPVIVTRVAAPRYTGGMKLSNPIELDELAELVTLLADEFGHEISDTWNGHPSDSGSIGLVRPAHPTMVAAVNRYHAGCTTHRVSVGTPHERGDVFCGRTDGCQWFAEGNRRMVTLAEVHAALRDIPLRSRRRLRLIDAAACPNNPPCEHPPTAHELADVADPLPACTAQGCDCGHAPAGWSRAEPLLVFHDGHTVPEHLDVMDREGTVYQAGDHAAPWTNHHGPLVHVQRRPDYRDAPDHDPTLSDAERVNDLLGRLNHQGRVRMAELLDGLDVGEQRSLLDSLLLRDHG